MSEPAASVARQVYGFPCCEHCRPDHPDSGRWGIGHDDMCPVRGCPSRSTQGAPDV